MDVKREVCLSVNLYQIEDRDQIYEWYDVPQKYQKLIKTSKTNYAKIEYICPNCATALKAEWHFVELVECDVKKNYNGIYCTATKNIMGRELIPRDWKEMPDFTDRDYENIQKIADHINNEIKYRISKIETDVCKVGDIDNCPICNAKLIKREPFTDILNGFGVSNLAWYKEYLSTKFIKSFAPFRDQYRKEGKSPREYTEPLRNQAFERVYINPVLDSYEVTIQSFDIPFPIKSYNTERSVNFLKEYLTNLINLETNILCMSKRLKELYLLRGKNDRDVAYEQGLPIFNFAKEVEQKNTALLDLKQEKQDFEKQPIAFQTVKYPPKPTKPEMLKANIFNKKKIAVLNAQAEAEYQEAIKKHLIEVEECKKRTEKNKAEAENQKKTKIKKYSERIDKSSRDLAMAQHELNQRRANASDYPTPAAGKKYVIDTEIASLEEALKKNFQCRNELYSYNVIFEKYRNIVAVSSFYEYLMAGRCDSLEGVNGAYNIYENESRMDAIITKLDEIETKLDEIKANQFMIYNKLNSIESSLNSLNRTMEKAVSSLESINTNTATMSKYLENISNNTDVIAHNTAVSAYYSKVNAELTNALGFMVALN